MTDKKLYDEDIVEKVWISEIDTSSLKIVNEEKRKNNHQGFQQKIAHTLICSWIIFIASAVLLGIFDIDAPLFEKAFDVFTTAVLLVIGFYFGTTKFST